MAKKHYSKCETCSGRKKSKNKRPYGTTGTNPYCNSCDVDFNYKISKKSERMKARNQIKKEIEKI